MPAPNQRPTHLDRFGHRWYRAHCVDCGVYIEDLPTEPPADYLCGDNVCDSSDEEND